MANNGGGTWTGGQDASFLHNFDTQQHIEAGLTCIKVGRGYRREALDATAAAEMRRLALESKAKFVDAVGHLMAALTDPGLPAAHQVLLREQVILYLDTGEEMYDLAREAEASESGAEGGKAVEYDAAKAYEDRTPCLKEILETERSYVRYLETLIEVYVQPLREDRQRSFFHTKVMSESDFKGIFGSVEQLVPLHKMFLEALEARWAQRSPQKDTTVGDLFIKFAPFFKIYHPFCNNFETSTKLISSLLSSRSSFAKFLAAASKNPRTRGNSLQSLMIMPVQRIARYALLIENVGKKTPEGHPDRTLLAEAAQRMKDTVGDINDTIKQHESRAKMFDVAYSFVPPQRMLVAAHRHFVKAGPLRYWRNLTVTEPDQLQAFLFNDIILFGEETGQNKQYTYVRQLKLQSVEDLADTSTHSNMFKIHGTVGQVRKTYVLSAGTNVDKSRWVEALYQCAEQLATRVRSMSVALDRAHLGARASVLSRVPSHGPTLTHAQSLDAPGSQAAGSEAGGAIKRSVSDRGTRSGAGGAGAGAGGGDMDDWCMVGAIGTPIVEDGEKEGDGEDGDAGAGDGSEADDFDLDGDLGLDFDASGVDLDDEDALGGDDVGELSTAGLGHRNSSLSADSPAHALSARLAALSVGTDASAAAASVGDGAGGGVADSDAHARPLPPRPAQASASSDGPAPPLPSRAAVESGASDGPPPLLPTRPRAVSTASTASEGPPPTLPARPGGDTEGKSDGKSDDVGDGGGAGGDGGPMTVCTVTADYTAGDDGELSVALGDQVMLLDTRLGEYARVQDALGNVGKVPSHCIRVHL